MAKILILGVLVAVVFYELTDVTPGGIIVPGLMVAFFNQPIRLAYTLAIAIAAHYLVRLLSRRFLIFGKRRFALLIIASFVLHVSVNLVFGLFLENFTTFAVSMVGYTASGIIANNMNRQGVLKTSCSLAAVVGILELLLLLLTSLGVAL